MRLAFAVLLGLGFFGCSGEAPYKGEKRYAVQGTVKYNDEPVHNGVIAFIGESTDPSKQFPSSGIILDGKYSIDENKGPNAGKYQVLINWSKPTGKTRKDPDTGETVDVVKEVIPQKYNVVTELRADVSAGTNTFDFDLKGPAAATK